MPNHRPEEIPPPIADEPLQRLIAALTPPLRFLMQGAPEAAARMQFPVARFLAEIESYLANRRYASVQATLEELSAALRALQVATPALRRDPAVRALSALTALERPAAESVAAYQRSTVSKDDLEALSQAVQFMAGVGPRRAEQFKKLGIETVEDMLYHLPFRYEDRRTVTPIRQVRSGDVVTVAGEIIHLAERHVGRTRRQILEGVVRDDSGLIALTWFQGVAYFSKRYQIGQRGLFHGKVEGQGGATLRIVHPEIEIDADAGIGQGVLPVYTKPTQMSVAIMRKLVHGGLESFERRVPCVLPPEVVRRGHVVDLRQAFRSLHAPEVGADVEALNSARSVAHRSIVFDELFFLQLGMALRRQGIAREAGRALIEHHNLTDAFRARLPFRFTQAQERVTREIVADLGRDQPMHRLVQGDVGSGKTVVALYAALVAIENDAQAALMAPTELLAEQHFATVSQLAEPLGIRTALLTGQLTRAEKKKLRARIESGEIQLAVGTHALIQEEMKFARLGVGIVDEQHRFGVLQRAALRRLAGDVAPDILLMTATPIPRTLAMTVYGDLDISVLDELPPGRQPVRTLLRHDGERNKVYDLVKSELDKGRQAYVVYPLVEESDDSDLRDATTMAQELAGTVFHGYRVGLVHGRMRSTEKDAVMRRFKAGDLQLLVSTTVIEVGIDVPNASIMVIEHAERFGLSQLHQLRGRVGRGSDAAYCVLLTPYYRGDDTRRRLEALAGSNDGFKIAEIDLEIRGPGDMIGTRQSGMPDFRVANLIRDRGVLEDARKAAVEWLAQDPTLSSPDSKPLRAVLAHRWAGRLELAEIG